MEENEIQLEFNTFLALVIMTTSSSSSSLCSDPLFSSIITLYTLLLIFYPYALKIFLSSVLILTSILLLFLLRIGVGQRLQISEKTEQNATGEEAGNKKNRANRDSQSDSIENFQSLDPIDKCVESQFELGFQFPGRKEQNAIGDATRENKISENRENRDIINFNSNENSRSLAEIDKWVESQVELGFQNPVKTEQNATGEAAGKSKIRENDENRDSNLDSNENSQSLTQIDKWVESQVGLGFEYCPVNQKFEHSFIEWNVRAPLEVIYEAYEGEEDDQDYEFSKRYSIPSLSMCYPETDSDSSTDDGFPVTGGWDSPESVYLKWEDEDRDGMLIEIALDSAGKHPSGTGFYFEEDNLIEIDISPRRNDGVLV